ncbi:MAG TPA: hypothetical protein VK390_01475 [Propionibacteriaceae bacterium]|nr:hypothetical protein [Propionibacteriaceae bacterium]
MAALGINNRLDLLGPPPAWLEDGASDGQLSQLDQLDSGLLYRPDLVGMVEALAAQLHGTAVYADQFRDRARTVASSRPYRSYLRLAPAVLLRRAFDGQPLQAPTQVLFGAPDIYISVAVLEGIEAHGVDLTLEVVEDCGHWMPEERPELIADRARALFR